MSTRIRYIGRAKTKGDNVTPSNVKWDHPGQVKVVPDDVAARLLNYPDGWVKEGAKNDPGPEALYRVNGIAGAFHYIDAKGVPVEGTPAPELIVDNTEVEQLEDYVPFTYSNDKEQAIIQAIKNLEVPNPKHFTDEGLPRVEAISELLGYAISAADRTKMWEAIQSDIPLTVEDMAGNVDPAAVVV